MLRTLVISSDPELVNHVAPALQKLEFAMDLKRTIADGMDKMRYERYAALVVDCALGSLADMQQSREQWLKRNPAVIAIAARGARKYNVPGADTVWTQPLMPWEVYRTLLNIRAQEVGDRRLRNRYAPSRPTPLRYTYDGQRFYEASIIDVTESGVAIAGIETPVVGQAVQVQFKLPAMLSPIDTLADVVWSTEQCAGLHFLQMPQPQQRQLERWLRNSRLGMSTGYCYAPAS